MQVKQQCGIGGVPAPSLRENPESDGLVLELPAPPSVNAIIGTRLGNSHSKIQRWRRAADAHLVVTRQHRKIGNPIVGDFTIDIVIDRIVRSHRRGDLDNRIKALLDYCEHIRIIENDGNCDGITANWGRVPAGCRLTLRPRLMEFLKTCEGSHEPISSG